jgi:membrane protein
MVLPGKGMGWKEFLKALKGEWERDDVGLVAGALTFFAVLALFPFLLFLVALAGLIINPQQAAVLVEELGRVAPEAATQILGNRIRDLAQSNSAGLVTLGALGAVWAASTGVVKLMRVLNTAYGVKESRPYWKVRGIAIVVTLVAAVLSILAAVGMVAVPGFAGALGEPLGTLLMWLRWPVAALLIMLVWALLYYFLPDVEQSFKLITPGSVVGVIIWLAASWAFSVYVRNFGNYDVTYGALGGVVVLLLWMWISAQALLLGAEINSILEHRSPEGKAPGGRKLGENGLATAEQPSRRPQGRPPGPAPTPEPAR